MKMYLFPVCFVDTGVWINKVALIIVKPVELYISHVDNLDRLPVLVL
jgi:hypothetical protein